MGGGRSTPPTRFTPDRLPGRSQPAATVFHSWCLSVRMMPYSSLASFAFAALIGLVCVGVSSAAAPAVSFTVNQHGHEVGIANFELAAGPTGNTSSSSVNVQMQGLEYAISKTEQLDQANHLQHVVLSGTVNGSAANVIGKPDGAQFLLNISANGRSSTSRLDGHPNQVFLPDFDPGALQQLLTLAAAQNNRDLWAIIPKQAGSIQPVQLATYADEQGTLDGRPIVVHHLVATIGGAETDLFSGPENQLLQVELPQEGFALVRKGFVLAPPKKPVAPQGPSDPVPQARP
jgi:hypothetical protein